MTRVANRDDFTDAKERTYGQVVLPSHGSEVIVRIQSLTELERIKILHDYGTDEKGKNLLMRAAFVAQCIVDEDGLRVFTSEDIPTIAQWRSHIVEAIYDAIDRLCQVDMVKDDERVERHVKNCEGTPNGDLLCV